jgi:hypothetical protein
LQQSEEEQNRKLREKFEEKQYEEEKMSKKIEKNDSQLILLDGSDGYYLENSDYKNDNSKNPDESSEKNDPVQPAISTITNNKTSFNRTTEKNPEIIKNLKSKYLLNI